MITIPKSLANLTKLTELNLSNNELITIPKSVKNHQNREVIYDQDKVISVSSWIDLPRYLLQERKKYVNKKWEHRKKYLNLGTLLLIILGIVNIMIILDNNNTNDANDWTNFSLISSAIIPPVWLWFEYCFLWLNAE